MYSETESTTSRRTAGCVKWNTCSVLSIVCIALLVGGFVVVAVIYTNKSKSSSQGLGIAEGGTAATQTGNIVVNSYGIDYRINPDSPCDGTSCSVCKTQVQSSLRIPAEALPCNEPRVKNSSCFECNGECKTLEYLRNHIGERIRCPAPVEINCCILSQMGNAGKICGIGGNYGCYNPAINDLYDVQEGLPICQCPFGRTGDRCQDIYREMMNCRCYNTIVKFCDQENMINCTSEDRDPGTSQCRLDVVRRGQPHNCLCSKATDADDDLDECTVPHTEPQTNDASNPRTSFFLVILLTIYTMAVTNNT